MVGMQLGKIGVGVGVSLEGVGVKKGVMVGLGGGVTQGVAVMIGVMVGFGWENAGIVPIPSKITPTTLQIIHTFHFAMRPS
jgi:hypothetical protein